MVKSTKLKISDSIWPPKFRKTEQSEKFLWNLLLGGFSVAEDEFEAQTVNSRKLNVKKQKLKIKVESLNLKFKISIPLIFIIKVVGSRFEFHYSLKKYWVMDGNSITH